MIKDAIAVPTGIAGAAVVSVALAIAAGDTVTPAPPAVEPAAMTRTEVSEPDEPRAIELATQKYGDSHYRFEVFAIGTHGDRRAVFVRRQTGVCGGCGALTVAVIFRDDRVEIVDKLGEYGRFGNGPAAIRVRGVLGHAVIEVDEALSMHGYSHTYREYFVIGRDRLEWQLCLHSEGSDSGARERASEWTSKIWIANEGTMYFVPDYTKRGEVTPTLRAFSFPFERGRWQWPEAEGRCIDPRSTFDPW
jgi:hypothetical protein